MNAPSAQSASGTPHTPHATLIPDHGTTPTSRSTHSRTHAGVASAAGGFRGVSSVSFCEPSSASSEAGASVYRADAAVPSIAFRVISSARGMKRTTNGASGAASSVAHSDPAVVSAVSSSVANTGENSAPASTFYKGDG